MNQPAGMVTFLFTDLEGSTQLWDDHPGAMSGALARHDAVLRSVIEEHGGHVVKSTGDGVCAAFAEPLDAVRAAAAAVRSLGAQEWETPTALRVRTGIHTGEAESRDGDYYGPALNRAARLMAAAHANQIVVSETTAALVRSQLPDDLRLVDLGEHRLRGIARPERAYQLVVGGLPENFPPLRSVEAFFGALDLPVPSIAHEAEITDRVEQLAHLQEAFAAAREGARRVVFLAGQAGIGKTRVNAELALRAHAQGAVVLYGRCDEDAVVPYQPFVEALRPCVASYSLPVLHERLHGLERDLARVFPDLSSALDDAPLPTSDPQAERYRLFEAITSLLTGVAATQPVVLLLDDLHWADKPTILLLRHVVRSAPRAALLIVGSYRADEVERDDDLAGLLADLRRDPSVTRLPLHGLAEDDAGELLRRRSGRDVAAPLVRALHTEADGNPFFLEELLRHAIESDLLDAPGDAPVGLGALQLPDGVRDVMGRRLHRLPREVGDLLGVAAIVGQEFDAALLADAAGVGVDTTFAALDTAETAGLVRQSDAATARYAFAHALVRQTVTAELGTARRAQLHANVGRAMEQAPPRRHAAAELARHFTAALPIVGPEKAIEYATQAGHDALGDVAFEDAATWFEHALELQERHAPDDAARRVELLTDLASALVYVDEQAGVQVARDAVAAARDAGDASQFGRAVTVFVEPMYAAFTNPAEVASVFDEAREVLGQGHTALRARLLAFEAFKYAGYQLQGRDARELARDAVSLARWSGDAGTLADALHAQAVSLEGSPDIAARVALGEELVRLGEDGSGRVLAFGLRVLARAHLEVGDADALTATIAQLARVGDERRWLPAHVYAAQWRSTQATVEGRFDDARLWGDELRRYARGYRGAVGMHGVQAFFLARERGALGAVGPGEPTVGMTDNLYVPASVALAQLEAGETGAARRTVAPLAADGFRVGEGETARGAALGMLAEVVATTYDRDAAAALYDVLLPYRERLLCVVLGLACLGSADRYLGVLAGMAGNDDDADAHFARAVELESQVHGRALLPRTRYWEARARFDRDPATAREMLAAVVADTAQLGMQRLQAQAEELLAR